MRELTVQLDEHVFEALVREGPTPEEAARRLLARSLEEPSAWEELERGLGLQGEGRNLSDTVDQALYQAR